MSQNPVEMMTARALSRRSLFRAGAATAAALGAGALFAGTAAAEGAGIPGSPYFDITKPSYDLFRSKMLHESHHVMQGFAFDNVNRRLFIVQAQNGTSGDDLCVSQLSFSGELLGSMHVNHAGHGVSLGVEPVGTASYIWMECDADGTTTESRGTALARFKFVDGGTPSVKKFLTGSKNITCATDPVYQRMAVRRDEGGRMWFSVYPLAKAAAGDFSEPLAHFPQPALSTSGVVFQGYTILGSSLYTLDGAGHADSADIDSYVTRIDMTTGAVKERAITRAGESLVWREPEGMAVYRTADGETRLFLGFGSRSSVDNVNRYANLFYKNVLVG
ncbi:teichoic acid biosynthesis protein C [Amycolatopsis sp. NPDC051045]|uniref:phage baseplate protein n=1 Tax=Amycolatopsis sp. NPDC051045 TaxID=3156922 RepID=UPI003414F56E